ncbi:hypothetical protein HanPI659440_Chr12g0469741 [Helianthus annuus]|nr:hypothetical protein HanPI659440_Chr12g0469741 [Helianthus annuus]
METILTTASNAVAVEGENIFFLRSLLTNQFAITWLPIKEADSRKVISQNISFNESSLCPNCQKTRYLYLEIRVMRF